MIRRPSHGLPQRTASAAGVTLAAVALAAAAAVWAPSVLLAQVKPRHRCDVCHGELEFLRQHVSTLPEARRLFVPADTVLASAHAEEDCSSCHTGFARYPHRGGTTRECASCHSDQDAATRKGVHSQDGPNVCVTCHGIHNVPSGPQMQEPGGIAAMNSACASCHPMSRLSPQGPHQGQVLCASCHRAHQTRSTDAPSSAVSTPNQRATCGTCHEDEAASWSRDVHGQATAEGVDSGREPPVCTACHGGHDLLPVKDPALPSGVTERCARCHERYAKSFADSYHGQAATLGSSRVATCQDCHGSHDILPASDPSSSVSPGHLLDTCRSCHTDAAPGFEAFEPHADPHDAKRYPLVFWAYWLMNALLFGVFVFFGTHTVLWVVRYFLDAFRGSTTGKGA